MILNGLKVVIDSEDLQRISLKIAAGIDKLKDISVELLAGEIVIGGRLSVGLTIPFKTRWRAGIINEGRSAVLTLAGVSVGMVGMGEEMITAQLLSVLKSRLPGHEAVQMEGREIIINLQLALKAYGITMNANMKRLEITPSGVVLEA